jgi:hypothetical protein
VGTLLPSINLSPFLCIIPTEFNILAETIPQTLGELKKMRELRLARNNLQGTLPEELGWLSQLGMLPDAASCCRDYKGLAKSLT